MVTNYYQCKKCGKFVKGKNRCNASRGDYTTAKCKCGNKGISNWHYMINGFNKMAPKEKWLSSNKEK